MLSEWTFQWLDSISRTIGRLTKCIRVANGQGVTLAVISKEGKRRDGHAAHLMEDKYPQLLIVNAPTWINVIFAMIKPFVPKRVLEKVNIVNPHKNQKDLDIFLGHCAIEHLPARYGGSLEAWPPEKRVPTSDI